MDNWGVIGHPQSTNGRRPAANCHVGSMPRDASQLVHARHRGSRLRRTSPLSSPAMLHAASASRTGGRLRRTSSLSGLAMLHAASAASTADQAGRVSDPPSRAT